MDRTELLKSERFIWFERSISPGTRYVRAMFAPPNTRPHGRMLTSKSIYGWTLDRAGVVVRVIYANCAPGPDGLPDGCGDWHSDSPQGSEAGTWVGVGKPLGPIPPDNSKPELCAEERMARREISEWWAQRLEQQAADEPRLRLEQENKALALKVKEAEAREAREQLDRDLAELESLRKLHKPGFIARLLGRP